MPMSSRLALSLIASAITLAACGDHKSGASQVVAKVNKEEISVHQINAVLARAGSIPEEQRKTASKQVLDRLIDQELLVQKAKDSKLDREPNVVQALEGARREILSRAYLEKITTTLPHPSAEEIHTYYTQHPELFAERRIYAFNEIEAVGGPELAKGLQSNPDKIKSFNDIIDWLKQGKVEFKTGSVTRPAEQMPLELLPRFNQMKDGQVAIVPSPNNRVLILQLAASKPAPLDEKAATPFIDQFIFNQRRNERMAKEAKDLRAEAKIDYLGEFAQSAKEATSSPAAANPPAVAAPAASSTGDDAVTKGLAGLK